MAASSPAETDLCHVAIQSCALLIRTVWLYLLMKWECMHATWLAFGFLGCAQTTGCVVLRHIRSVRLKAGGAGAFSIPFCTVQSIFSHVSFAYSSLFQFTLLLYQKLSGFTTQVICLATYYPQSKRKFDQL